MKLALSWAVQLVGGSVWDTGKVFRRVSSTYDGAILGKFEFQRYCRWRTYLTR